MILSVTTHSPESVPPEPNVILDFYSAITALPSVAFLTRKTLHTTSLKSTTTVRIMLLLFPLLLLSQIVKYFYSGSAVMTIPTSNLLSKTSSGMTPLEVVTIDGTVHSPTLKCTFQGLPSYVLPQSKKMFLLLLPTIRLKIVFQLLIRL